MRTNQLPVNSNIDFTMAPAETDLTSLRSAFL